MARVRENIHNFAAGPSSLPTSVLEQAAQGLLNYHDTGMGVCELSHRGKEFKAIIEGAEGLLASSGMLSLFADLSQLISASFS